MAATSPIWYSPPPDIPPRLRELAAGNPPRPSDAALVRALARTCTAEFAASPGNTALARPMEIALASMRAIYGQSGEAPWLDISPTTPWWALWFQILLYVAARPQTGNLWMNNALAVVVNAVHTDADLADQRFTPAEFLHLAGMVLGDVSNIARPSSMNPVVALLEETIHSRVVRFRPLYDDLSPLLGGR